MLIGHVRWIGLLANVWCSNHREFSDKSTQLGLLPYIARIKMKKCPLFVDVLSICRKCMIARVLNLLQLVAALSDRGQHQIVSNYLHGFKNYEFWKRGTRFVTLKSHCAI